MLIKHVGPCTLDPETRTLFASCVKTPSSRSRSRRRLLHRSANAFGPCAVAAAFGPVSLATLSDRAASERPACPASKLLYDADRCRGFFLDNPTLVRRFKKMSDTEVIESLLPIRGVGVWTAQMFLIFCLGRPRCAAADEPTLAFKREYAISSVLENCQRRSILEELAELWRPHRTAATWYFWRIAVILSFHRSTEFHFVAARVKRSRNARPIHRCPAAFRSKCVANPRASRSCKTA